MPCVGFCGLPWLDTDTVGMLGWLGCCCMGGDEGGGGDVVILGDMTFKGDSSLVWVCKKKLKKYNIFNITNI